MAYTLTQSIDYSDLSSSLQDDLMADLCISNDTAFKVSLAPDAYQMKHEIKDRLMKEMKALGVNMEMKYCFINFSW